MNKIIVKKGGALSRVDGSASLDVGSSREGEAVASGGPTSVVPLSSYRGRPLGQGWVSLWSVAHTFPPSVLRMLSVIFAQKAEIEKKNEENRWSREELRLERIPLQVLDVEGYIVANRLLGLLRRK